jgi:hypothetical protein
MSVFGVAQRPVPPPLCGPRLTFLLARRAAGLFLGDGRIGHVSPPGVVRSVSTPMIPAGPVAILHTTTITQCEAS